MCGIVGFTAEYLDPGIGPANGQGNGSAYPPPRPDGEGYYADTRAALGHRRLSIIDVNGGGQPMFNEDGTLVVVFNGEIYNYKPLRAELRRLGHTFATDSDTEVLLHGYEAWGAALPRHLRGMFAFALWDRAAGTCSARGIFSASSRCTITKRGRACFLPARSRRFWRTRPLKSAERGPPARLAQHGVPARPGNTVCGRV